MSDSKLVFVPGVCLVVLGELCMAREALGAAPDWENHLPDTRAEQALPQISNDVQKMT